MPDRRQSMSNTFSKYWGVTSLAIVVVFSAGSLWSDNKSLKANEEARKKEVQSYIATLDKVKDAIVAINLNNVEKDNNVNMLLSQVALVVNETKSLRQEMNAVHLKLAEHSYKINSTSKISKSGDNDG